MILFQSAFAAQIRLAWDPEPGVAGYKVYYGTASRVYGSPINVGNVTTYALTLTPGQTYFIAVTAYDQFGESGYSGELSAVSLTTSVNPGGGGTVNPSATTWYSSGQSVSVSATANSGYTFNVWSGDLSGSTNPSSIVMNGPKSITANFLSTKTNSNPKAISTPRTPTGPSKGATGSSYKYFTGGSISNLGDPVEYQFDWKGDGSTDLSSWGSATQSKTWTSAGTYRIRARARCATQTDIVSSWSNAISVSVVNKSFIQITLPEGSETYVVGTIHPVSWTSGYLSPNGTIYLFYWYDKAWHPIAALPPTATSYSWTIPDKPSGLGSVIPNSRIRSTSIWIGSWVGNRWECWGSSGSFKILYDEWIFTISGGDKGGAAIQFGESTFGGHGISFEWGIFEIEGTYGINADGSMSGTYTIYDLNSVVLETADFSGGVNSLVTAMTLRLNSSDGEPLFNMSGVRLLGEPVIPVDWKANISGSVQGTLDSLKIEPYQVGGDIYSRVFKVSGSGSIPTGLIEIEAYFFLTNAISYFPRGNIAYGIYTITGAISETGFFSGSLNPTSGTFKFSAASDDGKKYTFTGQIGK